MRNQTKTTKKTNRNTKTIVLVSLFWIVIAATVIAFIQSGQAQYNRGIFDGMAKTKTILQAK